MNKLKEHALSREGGGTTQGQERGSYLIVEAMRPRPDRPPYAHIHMLTGALTSRFPSARLFWSKQLFQTHQAAERSVSCSQVTRETVGTPEASTTSLALRLSGDSSREVSVSFGSSTET